MCRSTPSCDRRCHHQILYTRIPGYQRDHLRQAQTIDKTVFEYWTHALSYVPTRTCGSTSGHEAYRRDRRPWFTAVKKEDLRKVLALIRKRGALTIRDIDDDGWWKRSTLGEPQAIEAGAAAGFLRRRGDRQPADRHAETYELMRRHFGWERPRSPHLKAKC